MNIVLIRHDNSVKDYLFQTPAALHAGNRVLCNTSRGEQYGTAQCDSIEIGTDHDSQTVFDILVRIIGATLPLKNVVGLETKTVERFADKPAEPAKAEPKQAEAVKPSKYEGMSDAELSNAICSYRRCYNWGSTRKNCPSRTYCHDGKGSYAYILEHRAEAIAYLLAEDEAKAKQDKPAEPERLKPQYWSGKVVCIKGGRYHTLGAVYEIKDGIVNHDTGDGYNRGNPVQSVEQLNDKSVPQFIEFRGECSK